MGKVNRFLVTDGMICRIGSPAIDTVSFLCERNEIGECFLLQCNYDILSVYATVDEIARAGYNIEQMTQEKGRLPNESEHEFVWNMCTAIRWDKHGMDLIDQTINKMFQ